MENLQAFPARPSCPKSFPIGKTPKAPRPSFQARRGNEAAGGPIDGGGQAPGGRTPPPPTI